MSWIPRRHRSLIYKLFILIPVAWITIAFLMYNGNNATLNNSQQQAENGGIGNNLAEIVGPSAAAQLGTAKPLVANNPAAAVEDR